MCITPFLRNSRLNPPLLVCARSSEVSASEDLRLRLRQVTFDSREWEDEELLMLMQQMFLDLELTTTFGLDLPTLRTFLFTVYDNYNDVPFHNFRHCFCVAQMVSKNGSFYHLFLQYICLRSIQLQYGMANVRPRT